MTMDTSTCSLNNRKLTIQQTRLMLQLLDRIGFIGRLFYENLSDVKDHGDAFLNPL